MGVCAAGEKNITMIALTGSLAGVIFFLEREKNVAEEKYGN